MEEMEEEWRREDERLDLQRPQVKALARIAENVKDFNHDWGEIFDRLPPERGILRQTIRAEIESQLYEFAVSQYIAISSS
jgi:hypothetical protein